MNIYYVKLFSGLEYHIKADTEQEAIDIAIDIEKRRLDEYGAEKVHLVDPRATNVPIDNE